MRVAEFLFLALLVVYHLVLLAPRHRRLFPANYLVFLAGMALAWNLGLEGLRWQTIPPIFLLLIDLAVLFPSFATLRGRMPRPGILPVFWGSLRLVVAFVGFAWAVASAVLSVTFPLPPVELTGGLNPSERVVRFPPEGSRPGLELRVWYPASGDRTPLPREASTPEAWQRTDLAGGLPVFWQSYLERLPTANIVGGRMASPKTKYPVVYAAVPSGQRASDFAYLFEDLASRGFVVVSAGPVPGPLPSPTFDWATTWQELTHPLFTPALWLEPEKSLAPPQAADFSWLAPGQQALRILSQEPGDPFFQALDWSRQGLWVWGPGPSPELRQELGLNTLIAVGPVGTNAVHGSELWITKDPSPSAIGRRWVLKTTALQRADLADSAYLKPYLGLVGLKTQPDAGLHGQIRQYQAAFYQFSFWPPRDGSTFGDTVPQVPGMTLLN